MGFGKGFFIGLVLFIGLNVGLYIVYLLLSGGAISSVLTSFTDMSSLGSMLFGAIIYNPLFALLAIIGSILGSFDLAGFIFGIALFVSPLVAALITGKLNEGKGAAFGAWFLVSIISAVVVWVLFFIGGSASSLSLLLSLQGVTISGLTGDFASLILLIIVGAINGIFYGCFAVLMSGESY